MHRSLVFFAVLVFLVSWCPSAAAQAEDTRFQVGAHLAGVASSEFDASDFAFGGRLSWQALRLVGAEAELTFFPADFADDPAFSASRVEALFGVTVGPRMGAVRPFGKIRPGFLRFAEPPEPFACILIFPPPLACVLPGETVLALDAGGGIELFLTDRTFARIEAGDRILRYPGPAFDRDRRVHDDPFFSHDFRFQIGGGLRF